MNNLCSLSHSDSVFSITVSAVVMRNTGFYVETHFEYLWAFKKEIFYFCCIYFSSNFNNIQTVACKINSPSSVGLLYC